MTLNGNGSVRVANVGTPSVPAESRKPRWWVTSAVWHILCLFQFSAALAVANESDSVANVRGYRGPVDVVLLEQEKWCVTANELSNSVSLVSLDDLRVAHEVTCGARPAALARLNESELLVSCTNAGTIERFKLDNGQLLKVATIHVGFEPLGIAVDQKRQTAFVGLVAVGEIAQLDLTTNQFVRRFPSGKWPRYLTLSPDGSRLVVGLSGEGAVAVHDAQTGEQLYAEPLSGGINLGHLQCSADGEYAYFPWMVYRTNPITENNIQRGWVLASRVARVRLDGPSYREAISLDVPRRAVADPHGIAISPDETRMVVTSSGTHELLVYRLNDLPFVGVGGPGDLIDRRLTQDQDRFYRIELGGRPMAVRAMSDDNRFVVVNHTLDQLQIVDLNERGIAGVVNLGEPPQDAQSQVVHRGMELFYDAGRSLDQWYSCASCHLDGGSNARAMDTWNDGTELTVKTVPSLTHVTETGPWTWHGWQTDLRESIQNSFTDTMQGRPGTDEDVLALQSYLATLAERPSPFLNADGSLTESAERGRLLFESDDVGCAQCHSGTRFTDGMVHDVGLGSESDKYDGYNTPSLVGTHRKVRYLHDGRAKSLEQVLTKYHKPEEIGGGTALTDEQLRDLVDYLKSL